MTDDDDNLLLLTRPMLFISDRSCIGHSYSLKVRKGRVVEPGWFRNWIACYDLRDANNLRLIISSPKTLKTKTLRLDKEGPHSLKWHAKHLVTDRIAPKSQIKI